MTQYNAAEPPRRRIGLKAPITGLVLIGLVVYGAYWGWERAMGDASPEETIAGECPTPSGTTTAPATPAAAADGEPAIGSAVVVLVGQAVDPGLSAGALQAAAPTTPAPTATPTGPLFVQPGGVLVNVINATGRRGLAANTAAVLRDRGFAVQDIGNAPADDLVPEAAQIRASAVDSAQVLLLVQHVPGAVIVADGRTDATIDLVLGDAFSALGDPTLVTPVPLPSSTC